ncbi:hypothetical protein HYT23_03645 [Candidatus Pacearchaeota archaeon]|nr:hypothetical protein [Candidatus Pacearchaeota archaeon]
MNQAVLFIIALLIPFIYYRSLYYIYRTYFKESKLRASSGLQIHHLHYGAIILIITAFILIFYGKNNYVLALFGLGLGLVLDEFVPALLMPGNRKIELAAYEKGFIPTLIIFLLITLTMFFVYFVF